MTQFYTYLWLREDGTPYYVGKGKGRRAFVMDGHRHRPPSIKDRILLQAFPTEEDAFAAEAFLISYYGRMDKGTGCLRNLTDGGEGVSGHQYSAEVLERKRNSMLGKNKGIKRSEETCRKLSESHRAPRPYMVGRKASESAIKALKESHIGKPWSAARRLSQKNHVKGKKYPKMSLARLVYYQRKKDNV